MRILLLCIISFLVLNAHAEDSIPEEIRKRIEHLYDTSWEFKDSIASVEKDGLYGYVNMEGQEVLRVVYEKTKTLKEGLGLVKKDGEYGFVDKTGTVIIPMIYDYSD